MRKERLSEILETAERHIQAKRFRRALSFYRKALTLARMGEWEWELAQVRLADLHLLRGELVPAISHLLKAHQMSSAEPRYSVLLGRTLRLLGEPERASQHLFDACESTRDRAAALLELAHATADMGNRSLARSIVNIVERTEPLNSELQSARMYTQDA